MATATLPTAKDVLAYQAAVWRDPVRWIREALGVHLWSRQRQIVEAVRDHPRVAVRSANAVGKSYTAAALTLAFLEAFRPAYVVTTSASWRGIEKVLWPEIRRLHRTARVDLGGRLLGTEWKRDDQWAAFGVSADTPENFAGFRTSHGILVIVDEASALDEEIFEAIMGLTATAGSRVLLIGNPLRPQGPFFDTFSSPGWRHLHLSALECPNVVAGREVVPGLATREWVEERKEEWGEDSPAYQARVLGEFPVAGEHTLIPLTWLQQAAEADHRRIGSIRMGVDVGDVGGDATVLLVRDDGGVIQAEAYNECGLMETAGRIIVLAQKHGVEAAHVAVDCIGVGAGVVSRLHELGFKVSGVNFGSAPADGQRFANLRAECYWRAREALHPEAAGPFHVPERMGRLHSELSRIEWQIASNGKVQIEPKDKVKARIGRSPDWADAFALSFAGVTSGGDWLIA